MTEHDRNWTTSWGNPASNFIWWSNQGDWHPWGHGNESNIFLSWYFPTHSNHLLLFALSFSCPPIMMPLLSSRPKYRHRLNQFNAWVVNSALSKRTWRLASAYAWSSIWSCACSSLKTSTLYTQVTVPQKPTRPSNVLIYNQSRAPRSHIPRAQLVVRRSLQIRLASELQSAKILNFAAAKSPEANVTPIMVSLRFTAIQREFPETSVSSDRTHRLRNKKSGVRLECKFHPPRPTILRSETRNYRPKCAHSRALESEQANI